MDLEQFQHDAGFEAVEFFSSERRTALKRNSFLPSRANKTVNITAQFNSVPLTKFSSGLQQEEL